MSLIGLAGEGHSRSPGGEPQTPSMTALRAKCPGATRMAMPAFRGGGIGGCSRSPALRTGWCWEMLGIAAAKAGAGLLAGADEKPCSKN